MVNLGSDIWRWYHNISECHYHLQITVKYRLALSNQKVQKVIAESLQGVKQRYAIEIGSLGFDRNHLHILLRFLPKYSGGQVVKIIKSISAKQVFAKVPEVKQDLWGGEFWTDGYYIATLSGRGNRRTIEQYIKNQGRKNHVKQLRFFNI